ncbi:MAG: hypothetical protein LBH29_06470 [Elusimicrobiota bacterium]|nr:hypothetical protein [Elusimicrobiota bacterium]
MGNDTLGLALTPPMVSLRRAQTHSAAAIHFAVSFLFSKAKGKKVKIL